MDDDIIPIDYKSLSDFYAKTAISDLQRYHDVFTENEEARDKSPTQALAAIVKVLDLSGISLPHWQEHMFLPQGRLQQALLWRQPRPLQA
ncbi:hypothetical protein BGZ98_010257 [Dissophora globulifera]|nr:hypothetical protein BGZ98_010257 [Dissophora globulifera]